MTQCRSRSLQILRFVTDYPKVGEAAVVDDEGSDEVGVRRCAVLQVGGDGLVEGGVARREDGRVVDQTADEVREGSGCG